MLSQLINSQFYTRNIFFAPRVIHLHAMITACGYQHITTEEYNWDGMKRGNMEFIVWQYTLDGEGYLEYKDKLFNIPSGHGMLLHIPDNHRYFFSSEKKYWDFIYVCMNRREIIRICRDLEKRYGPVNPYSPKGEAVATAAEIIIKARNNELNEPGKISYFAYKLTMSVMDELFKYGMTPNHNIPEFISNVIQFAVEHIHEENMDVNTLASVSGFSRYHFCRMFKKYYGISPGAFLKDLRLKKAIRLLQTERLSIKEIASQSGFSSSSYF